MRDLARVTKSLQPGSFFPDWLNAYEILRSVTQLAS